MLKHKKRLSQLYRALFCTRLTTLFIVAYEASKILAALAVFAFVWHRQHHILPFPPLSTNNSTSLTSSSPSSALSIDFPNSDPGANSRRVILPWSSVLETNPVAFVAVNKTKKRSKIFCICSTTGPRHQERALHVRTTWGRRCDKLVFASDLKDPLLPAEAFWNETGRRYVTFKMFGAWQWVHDHFLDDYEWFLKADDDTFVVMENLRLFLDKFDHDDPYYFGRPLATNRSKFHMHYVSGSAYVLSRNALSRLVKESFPNKENCPGPKDKANEDAYIGYCLFNIGIPSFESRDELKRNRFLVFSSWTHLHIGSASSTNWIWRYDKNYVEGEGCCSPHAVSLHYMPGGKMLTVEYLLYRLRPFGVGNSVVHRSYGPA